MALAILCSGQGTQHGEMFALTGNAPAAEYLFTHASRLLGGRDPREMVATIDDTVHENRVAQILFSLQALAAVTALRDSMPERIVVAGYSVGEMAAWGVAGCFSMSDTLDLVARRAEVMNAVTAPGDGLLFVRGLSREIIEALSERHGTAIAIVEPEQAFIVGGDSEALHAVEQESRSMHATAVIRLAVQVASHTPRLANASAEFRDILNHVQMNLPPAGTRLLSGVDGSAVIAASAGLDKLAAQISHTVQWAACLQGCIEAGATAFLELGPGRALTAMAARAYPDVAARSLEDFRTLRGAQAWLALREI
ncbi:MAG: acyltransferase domain-containing protein [Steroidobacteraceae bacterium]